MSTNVHLAMKNIFMGWFEEKFIFPFLTNLRNFYLHFMDIFLIWNDTKMEFDFFKKISECHQKIKVEYEMSKSEINFLDTTAFKVDNQLRTRVYINISHA